MQKHIKFTLINLTCVLMMTFSCGDPNEAMNKTMADFSEKCLKEEYVVTRYVPLERDDRAIVYLVAIAANQ